MRRVALAGATFRAERAGGGDPEAEVRQMYLGKANVALVDARLAATVADTSLTDFVRRLTGALDAAGVP